MYAIFSLSSIPYLMIALFTGPYFAQQIFNILSKIDTVPAHLSVKRKNEQIKMMIYSFILIIYSFGIALCLSNSVVFITLGSNSYNMIVINTSTTSVNSSCTVEVNTNFGAYIDISDNLVILLPILVNLFLTLLRMAYLDQRYKNCIIRYSSYFLFRLISIILLAYFFITNYLVSIIELPFMLFDFYIYVKVNNTLYLQLKKIREKVKWDYSNQEKENQIKINLLISFFNIIRTFLFSTFILYIMMAIINCISEVITIMHDSDCLIHYVFPNTPISFIIESSLAYILSRISYYNQMLKFICTIMVGVIQFMANLAVLKWIITIN